MLWLASGTVAAQQSEGEDPSIREARARFEIAADHHEAGDFALALREFQEVHGLMVQVGHPNAPLVLFNVARCYASLDRDAEAIDAYERFLAESRPDAPNRDVAQAELRELRARQAIRGEDGRPGDEGGGGGISPVGPIIAGVGAAVMVAGAVTGGLTLAAEADATEGCLDGRCPAELGPRADEAHLLANITDGLLFGGLAVAAVGVVLVFILQPDGADQARTSAGAACTPDACMASARVRF